LFFYTPDGYYIFSSGGSRVVRFVYVWYRALGLRRVVLDE
jgi:hypothetical protein